MNGISYALVDSVPGGDGIGRVQYAGSTRACYFHPARFMAPWPVPVAGLRVAVQIEGGNLVAYWTMPASTTTPPAPVTITSAAGGAKANTAAPSGWYLAAFDDSAWLPTVLASGFSGITGADLVAADAASSPAAYFRQPFILGAGITTATLHLAANDAGVAPIYVNGTAFYTGAPMFTTYDLDITSAIVPGGANLLAFGASAAVLGGTVTRIAYSVEAS